ncbi:helix-turn-helix domain-containing protein [Streptosporangium sp. CA-135522]|uniref:helix-turn-helix domain-containing protein n=1 Tax=Streptosporangium sp. CA-135522 TaxID=3240072 RepID=UPI003D92F7D1
MRRAPHPVMAALARRRRELGVTQGALARRLFVSESAICFREIGRASPCLAELDQHARALGLRVALVPLGERNDAA